MKRKTLKRNGYSMVPKYEGGQFRGYRRVGSGQCHSCLKNPTKRGKTLCGRCARGEPVQKPGGVIPKSAYTIRDELILKLFQCDYATYLSLPIWIQTRKTVLARDSHKCRVCTKPATEVHHRSYDEDTLRGATEHLVSLCRGCHEFIEMTTNGTKRGFEDVEARLSRLMEVSVKASAEGDVRSRPLTSGELNESRRALLDPSHYWKNAKKKRRSGGKKRNGRRRVK